MAEPESGEEQKTPRPLPQSYPFASIDVEDVLHTIQEQCNSSLRQERGELLRIITTLMRIGRFDDACAVACRMFAHIITISNGLEQSPDITEEERVVLGKSFIHVINTRRDQWHRLNEECRKEDEEDAMKTYRTHVADEITDICDHVMFFLSWVIDLQSYEDYSTLFYLKLYGDFSRYRCEISPDDEFCGALAEEAYRRALALSETLELSSADPMILALSLNRALMVLEFKSDTKHAIDILKQTLSNADIDTVHYTEREDSLRLLDSIKSNLTLWKYELKDEQS